MPQDNSAAFLANPTAFIGANPIILSKVDEVVGAAFPAANNINRRMTLTSQTVNGLVPPNQFPSLRMQAAGAPAIINLPGGGVLGTIDSYYVPASDGNCTLNNMWYCDIPIAGPAAGGIRTLFTTGMNGCSLIVASAVPAGAPPLAAGFWRVMHDHDHQALNVWDVAGYTLRFAAYPGAGDAGPIPPTWLPAFTTLTYNPHNYPWAAPPPVLGAAGPIAMRVVTNFLFYNGANWTFNSRHAFTYGAEDLDMDAVPAGGPASTQTHNI